jgi:hypothetical protein
MFLVSDQSLFFDYFRIPNVVLADGERSELTNDAPASCAVAAWQSPHAASAKLLWPRTLNGGGAEAELLPQARYRVDSIPFFARVVPDAAAHEWLSATRRSWRKETPILDGANREVAWVRRDENGSTFLPFDPGEAMRTYWSEGYLDVDARLKGAKQLALRAYYRLRPAIPRRLQLAFRRRLSRVQGRSSFPGWPIEPALHDLYDVVFGWVSSTAGEPVPWLAPWPDNHSWALVLTHDVETEAGIENIDRVAELETRGGYRSSWNFVPRRYDLRDELVASLVERGFEVGVHGLFHDGRDLESLATLTERLPEMHRYAKRWGATGFRAPATHRVWEWMPLLGFDYDSSYPDTDPYEPQSGGCCTWLPFFNDELVELPITLPQDHTLFAILGQTDASTWVEKASYIRRRGGMALLITHPDYLHGATISSYARLLATFADDTSVWRAVPREVSAWWRRRAASSVERNGHGWRVAGPAAGEASIRFASPSPGGAG